MTTGSFTAKDRRMRGRFLWRALRARLKDQAMELGAAKRALGGQGLAVDVGANKGSYLYWLARWAPHVIAFEPQPLLHDYLQRACRKAGLKNVTIERLGVADATGDRLFYVPSEGSPEASLVERNGAAAVTIHVVSLDEYFPVGTAVDLIKIDIEGAELSALKGARRVIRDSRPVIIIEIEHRHLRDCSIGDIFHEMESHGYSGYYFWRDRILPVGDFDVRKHQIAEGERFWKHPDYVNNFLFKP